MRLIPVLDLKGGRVVDARGGDRRHYRPLSDDLHEGSEPISWAIKARDEWEARELYIADLDAIDGGEISWNLIEDLARVVPKLWVDLGVRGAEDWNETRFPEEALLAAGTETLNGSAGLKRLIDRLGKDRVVMSLDLRDGRPIVADYSVWEDPRDPVAVAREAVDQGIGTVLLLDLARVGSNQGTGTTQLLRALKEAHPKICWAVGGGISGRRDLVDLAEAGASAALIGSAWRSGRLTRADRPADAERPD